MVVLVTAPSQHRARELHQILILFLALICEQLGALETEVLFLVVVAQELSGRVSVLDG